MSDEILPRFEPAGVLPTFKDEAEHVHLTRHTTTAEQRQEALAHALKTLRRDNKPSMRLVVVWTRGEPTMLEVIASVEHVAGGQPFYALGAWAEYSLEGSRITPTMRERSEKTIREIAEMAEEGML